MGLFATRVEQFIDSPPDTESREYLEANVEHWLSELKRTDLDKVQRAHAETQLRVYQDNLSLLKFAKPPSPRISTDGAGFWKPDRNTYLSLKARAKAMDLPDDYIEERLKQAGVNLQTFENWTDVSYYDLNSVLKELEHKSAQLGKRRKKRKPLPPKENAEEWPGPIAEPGMKSLPIGDGTFNHVNDLASGDDAADSDDYEAVVKWAAQFNVARIQIAGYWGPIVTEHGWTKRAMLALQKKISDYVKNLPKPEGKKLSLFAKTKVENDKVVNTETGEAKPLACTELKDKLDDALAKVRAAELDAIREELGLKQIDVPVSIGEVEYILRKRSLLLAELSEVMKRYDEIKGTLENQIRGLEEFYKPRLEAYRRANPPPTGKTLKTLYGDLALRNTPQYISLDYERDPDKSLLRGWVINKVKEKIDLYSVFKLEEVKTINFDWDKVKEWYGAELQKDPKLAIPGVKVTPPATDKFFISPGLDAMKQKIREELKK